MTLELPCPCVSDHVPNPKVVHRHHIVPKAWGGTDDEPPIFDDSNLVAICPTCHENVHDLLNEYVRHQTTPPWDFREHFTQFERFMADLAWSWWVTNNGADDKPPWTLPAGVETVTIRDLE